MRASIRSRRFALALATSYFDGHTMQPPRYEGWQPLSPGASGLSRAWVCDALPHSIS